MNNKYKNMIEFDIIEIIDIIEIDWSKYLFEKQFYLLCEIENELIWKYWNNNSYYCF